jgi:hypothetical protein
MAQVVEDVSTEARSSKFKPQYCLPPKKTILPSDTIAILVCKHSVMFAQ